MLPSPCGRTQVGSLDLPGVVQAKDEDPFSAESGRFAALSGPRPGGILVRGGWFPGSRLLAEGGTLGTEGLVGRLSSALSIWVSSRGITRKFAGSASAAASRTMGSGCRGGSVSTG